MNYSKFVGCPAAPASGARFHRRPWVIMGGFRDTVRPEIYMEILRPGDSQI